MTEAIEFLRENGVDPADMMEYPLFPPTRDRCDAEKLVQCGTKDLKQLMLRQQFIAKFGFAVLAGHTIELLRPFAPLVEVGSGSGYWAYELRKAGVDIVATDPGKGEYDVVSFRDDKMKRVEWQLWIKIERLTGVEAVQKYPERTLLIVWPDEDDPWAAETLAAYRGDAVIYVGEGSGGRTGDDRFHELLERDFEQTENRHIPHFYAIYDRLGIWERKRANARELR